MSKGLLRGFDNVTQKVMITRADSLHVLAERQIKVAIRTIDTPSAMDGAADMRNPKSIISSMPNPIGQIMGNAPLGRNTVLVPQADKVPMMKAGIRNHLANQTVPCKFIRGMTIGVGHNKVRLGIHRA